ncbi:MAG: helix-turn-helix transcriptional regulator [Cyanobacteria bacterium SIG32]|nr:helix-turn-helix transcriptional regulator [Cyanobacteria bacterium SIG32]
MQDGVENNSIKLIKTLGSIIEKHRKEQGKTIYKISAESSMSKSTWREAELGVCKNMTITTLWKIAEGLEITPAMLMEELSNKLGKDFTLSDFD